jgi:hypothetical protein
MIYIITVKFGYFFDGLGFLCWGFEFKNYYKFNLKYILQEKVF